MTKREIYEQVVRLTDKLAQTEVAKKIFAAAFKGDVGNTRLIIDAFPLYYPELHKEIVSFGEKYNKLVGNSTEDAKKIENIRDKSFLLMDAIVRTNFIGKINNAIKTGDSTKINEVIVTFIEEEPCLIENIVNLQEKFSQYQEESNKEENGAIFGTNTDEEKGIFVFDTNIIDVLSFYVLCIFANISDAYLFRNWEDDPTSSDKFNDAILEATNGPFWNFVRRYNIIDWIGKDCEYEDQLARLLVDILAEDI